jgi:integrase
MSVTVRPYRGGPSLEVDVRVEHPDGSVERVRRRFKNGTSEALARRWGERVQTAICQGKWTKKRATQQGRPVKTLAEFRPIYLDLHCVSSKDKPSYIAIKRRHLTKIQEVLPDKPLDKYDTLDVVTLRDKLSYMVAGSVNNHLATFSSLLQAAKERKEISTIPCEIKLLPLDQESYPECYSFEDYGLLVDTARALGRRELVAVLCGGDAGLRVGEVAALQWGDIDLDSGAPNLTVKRTAWNHIDLTPKTRKERRIPLTARLAAALKALLEHTSEQVLESAGGTQLVKHDNIRFGARYVFSGSQYPRIDTWRIWKWFTKVHLLAGLPYRRFHALRHTFCSHLAARGVPAVDIKDLAGHRSLHTTEKYMHNLPGSKERGIAMLEAAPPSRNASKHKATAPVPRPRKRQRKSR